MEFVWLNKQVVPSDQGFVLQRMKRFVHEYHEVKRTMRLRVEDIATGSCGFNFYASWREAKWQSPFENILVTEIDRERIVNNIKAAMVFMNARVKF